MSGIDILIVTETKLGDSIPEAQFFIVGFAKPYRLDRTENGGVIMIYVREDIPSRSLEIPSISLGIENIFIEMNLRKIKWLIGSAYIPQKHFAPTLRKNWFYYRFIFGEIR